MTSRDAIFAAIRAVRPDVGSPATIGAQAAACAEVMAKTLPALEEPDLEKLFTLRAGAEKVGATIERMASLAELPQAVARYAEANALAPQLALQPDPRLQALDWGALKSGERLRPDTALAVGLALCGISETGSLVFHSGPTAPTLFGFLPLHHIVALDANSLLPRFEDYAASDMGKLSPRNVNFITGASGTTDIEGVLARGAHGPRKLHIVIYG